MTTPPTRKLKPGWTFEFTQDLKTPIGEEDLDELLCAQLKAEIDSDILGELMVALVHKFPPEDEQDEFNMLVGTQSKASKIEVMEEAMRAHQRKHKR